MKSQPHWASQMLVFVGNHKEHQEQLIYTANISLTVKYHSYINVNTQHKQGCGGCCDCVNEHKPTAPESYR